MALEIALITVMSVIVVDFQATINAVLKAFAFLHLKFAMVSTIAPIGVMKQTAQKRQLSQSILAIFAQHQTSYAAHRGDGIAFLKALFATITPIVIVELMKSTANFTNFQLLHCLLVRPGSYVTGANGFATTRSVMVTMIAVGEITAMKETVEAQQPRLTSNVKLVCLQLLQLHLDNCHHGHLLQKQHHLQ